MIKMIWVFFSIAVSLSFFVLTAEAKDEWITVSKSDNGTVWQARPGSLEFTQNKAGDPIVVAIGRVTIKSSNNIMLEKWYVKLSDCINEYGTLATLNMSGDFKNEDDFVFGSGNVASSIAEIICGAAKQAVIEAEGKGI